MYLYRQYLSLNHKIVCRFMSQVVGGFLVLYITCNLMYFQRGGGSKAASSPAENYHLARRRTLQVVVSALLTECGFESAEKAAVETLTEMMQSCMYDHCT